MIDLSQVADEVVPGLWQGPAPAAGEYPVDIIVLAASSYQPSSRIFPNVQVIRIPLRDVEALPTDDIIKALEAARKVAVALQEGKKVLVTCQRGWNRSGLISGLALRFLGADGDTAIHLVRKARGADALSNPVFARFVQNADIAALPTPISRLAILGGLILIVGFGWWIARR